MVTDHFVCQHLLMNEALSTKKFQFWIWIDLQWVSGRKASLSSTLLQNLNTCLTSKHSESMVYTSSHLNILCILYHLVYPPLRSHACLVHFSPPLPILSLLLSLSYQLNQMKLHIIVCVNQDIISWLIYLFFKNYLKFRVKQWLSIIKWICIYIYRERERETSIRRTQCDRWLIAPIYVNRLLKSYVINESFCSSFCVVYFTRLGVLCCDATER